MFITLTVDCGDGEFRAAKLSPPEDVPLKRLPWWCEQQARKVVCSAGGLSWTPGSSHSVSDAGATTIGERLRTAREAAGLTVEQAANAICCTVRNLQAVESGTCRVTACDSAAYHYHVRAEWLLTGEGQMREGES